MTIEVRVTSTLRNLVGVKAVYGEGANVGELFADLDAKYPGFIAQISGEDGQLHRFVNVYVNDEDIRYISALDTPLKDGDVVSILPALAGGAGQSRHGLC
jgi:MoaD family protein